MLQSSLLELDSLTSLCFGKEILKLNCTRTVKFEGKDVVFG